MQLCNRQTPCIKHYAPLLIGQSAAGLCMATQPQSHHILPGTFFVLTTWQYFSVRLNCCRNCTWYCRHRAMKLELRAVGSQFLVQQLPVMCSLSPSFHVFFRFLHCCCLVTRIRFSPNTLLRFSQLPCTELCRSNRYNLESDHLQVRTVTQQPALSANTFMFRNAPEWAFRCWREGDTLYKTMVGREHLL